MQRGPQARGERGGARVVAARPFGAQQSVTERAAPLADVADPKRWEEAERDHPGDLVVVSDAAVFDAVTVIGPGMRIECCLLRVEYHVGRRTRE